MLDSRGWERDFGCQLHQVTSKTLNNRPILVARVTKDPTWTAKDTVPLWSTNTQVGINKTKRIEVFSKYFEFNDFDHNQAFTFTYIKLYAWHFLSENLTQMGYVLITAIRSHPHTTYNIRRNIYINIICMKVLLLLFIKYIKG